MRLHNTNIHDETEYKAYRLDIKKRLNLTYHKQRMEIKKLEKSGIDPQWIHASLPTVEDRIEQLKTEYKVGIRICLTRSLKFKKKYRFFTFAGGRAGLSTNFRQDFRLKMFFFN